MAQSFYYKKSKISQDDLDAFDTLTRNNAFVTIRSINNPDIDFQLPIPDTSFIETYNPNATGRSAPILKDVKISLEGEAASLRRAEVAFTCFDLNSFQEAEAAFLVPGAEIEIEYGYSGPETPASTGKYQFRVFDFSFKLTKQNYFECSLKAVAPGTGAEFDVLDINGPQQFGKLKLKFITDYNGITDEGDVRNIFDFIDYQIQKGTNEDFTGFGANSFDPDNGVNGPCDDGGHWAVIVAPRKYEPEGKLKVGWFTFDRIVYITLEAIVSIVNTHILKENKNGYQIQFDPNWSSIQYQHDAGKIWSPTPSDVLFPYTEGTAENNYKNDKISIDNLYEADVTAVEDFRIDNSDSSSPAGGDPKGILISRDVVRGIQSEFNQQAMSEDDTTEEKDKAKSTIPLIKFFKKIFGVIRENSGGDWDLSLEVSEDNVDSSGLEFPPGTIWIVNKKAPVTPSEKVTPLMLDPVQGKNGIRELALEGSVPKDVQAEAFGGAPEVTPGKTKTDIIARSDKSQTLVTQALAEAQAAYDEEIEFLTEESPKAQDALDTGNYGSDVTSAAKGIVKRIVQCTLPDAAARNGKFLEPRPWPLSLKLTMDGIEGFRFGDTIGCTYLPERYTKNEGVRVVFTVTSYTHTISNNDWKTEITTVSRIVGD